MPVTFQRAEKDVTDLVAKVMAEAFDDLAKLKVEVDVLMAFAARDKDGEPKGCALKLHGVPCLAIVKVTSLKDRVAGLGDVRILIDGDQFPHRTAEEQEAIIHHELQHLVIARDKDGNARIDDAFRPVLKTRPHDAELGVFFATIDRYKTAAIEAQAYRALHREMSQRTFPWG